LPIFTRGQVELLDDKVLLSELRGLERRARSSGRDLMTHGPMGDDAANAVCGVMVLAKRGTKLEAGLLFPRRERIGRPRIL
jgi:hypothetical protein